MKQLGIIQGKENISKFGEDREFGAKAKALGGGAGVRSSPVPMWQLIRQQTASQQLILNVAPQLLADVKLIS